MGRIRYPTKAPNQAQTQGVKLTVSELRPSAFDDSAEAVADRVERKSVSDTDRSYRRLGAEDAQIKPSRSNERFNPTTEVHAEARKRGEIQIPLKKDVSFPTSAFPRPRVMISCNLDFGVRVQRRCVHSTLKQYAEPELRVERNQRRGQHSGDGVNVDFVMKEARLKADASARWS